MSSEPLNRRMRALVAVAASHALGPSVTATLIALTAAIGAKARDLGLAGDRSTAIAGSTERKE